jgi:hypothetical protein
MNPPYGLRVLGNEGEPFGVANRLDGEVHVKVRPIQVMRSRTLDVEQRSYDEPGKAKRRRRARDSRVSGVKSLCELAREP